MQDSAGELLFSDMLMVIINNKRKECMEGDLQNCKRLIRAIEF